MTSEHIIDVALVPLGWGNNAVTSLRRICSWRKRCRKRGPVAHLLGYDAPLKYVCCANASILIVFVPAREACKLDCGNSLAGRLHRDDETNLIAGIKIALWQGKLRCMLGYMAARDGYKAGYGGNT